jgi:hypothetical protein
MVFVLLLQWHPTECKDEQFRLGPEIDAHNRKIYNQGGREKRFR